MQNFYIFLLVSHCYFMLNKSEMIYKPDAQYTILWMYKVPTENKTIFEHEYGPHGSWSKLFSKSPNYFGSDLISSENKPGVYFLIDKWKNFQSYNDFKNSNLKEYTRLSGHFEPLYESEKRIGSGFRVPML